MDISVIVPIYYGKEYIVPMIKQIEKCKEQIPGYSVELLFVNDAPDDRIEDIFRSDTIAVLITNTDRNRGIQGTRIRGLEECQGEFVLFLDQDDLIRPEYFASQMAAIVGHDVSVCRALHENKLFYDSQVVFEQAVSRKYMLEKGCGMVSPGQALIRRDAVSDIWKKNIVPHNGADDWLLWLCMFGEGKRFALNQDVLYEHVVHGANTSINTEGMLASEEDVYEILKKETIYSAQELQILKETICRVRAKHHAVMDKFKRMFLVYDMWMNLETQGKTIEDYLQNNGYFNVAIYGYGYIGKQLLGKLKRSNVKVSYLVDQNAQYIEEEIPVYTIDDTLPVVDAIVVTLVEKEETVISRIENVIHTKVFSIKEMLLLIESADI